MTYAFNSKKGQVSELAIVAIMLAVLAITVPLALTVLSHFNTAVQQDADLSAASKNISGKANSRLGVALDGAWMLALVLATIGIVIGSFIINTYPAFLIFSLVFMIFLLIAGALVGNAYSEIENQSVIVTSSLTFIPYVMERFVQFIGALGVLMLVALYTKARRGGGE